MINKDDSFKDIKNDENILCRKNDGNILHIKNKENMINFDTILQDPCATPVSLTLDFLKGITNDFSDEKVLGHGGFGVVYKGVLGNGKAIAVKRLKILETNLNDEQYQKELRNLFALENKNVVQFKGYCAHSSEVLWPESQSQRGDGILVEVRERLLCFEYLSNRSLREHISDASCGLEWLVRYEIIKGICSGLHYLHTERDIAHMDLKPENILLDDNMVPKIGDFGTSRLFAENQSRIITDNCVGSRGYMAPEYQNRGMISKKADIYSFGVIILELLTGSKSDYPERKELFQQFTEDVVRKWRNRLPTAEHSRQVRACISIALNCVDANRDRRPTTGYIINNLTDVQDPTSSWSWVVQKSRKIAIGVGALILMLLNPSSSWSSLVTALNFVTVAVALHAVGFTAIVLVLYKKNQCSSRPLNILFAIGAILVAVLVLLNQPNSIGPWTVITLKLVTMAGLTLFAVGVLVLHVFYHQHVLDIFSALFFGLVAAIAAAARILGESSVHPSKDNPEQPTVAVVAPVAALALPSPNGKFKQKITSWIRGALLGSGSFGTVYEGINDEGEFFAVKEVSLLDAQHSLLQLEQEIALLSQFDHENIVQYYGTGKDDSKLHIFIELVTRGSLASLYQKYKLRESQVPAYTTQILNGLVYLHERNVVHRNIKCANILVHANGSVKLADFGLAKVLLKINMLRSCEGSVYWMAPEVINPKKTYGLSADIWSLGCTVLEMLTGQVPYSNVEWTTACFMIGRGEQPPIPNSLSKEAQDFIGQCVRVDPEERPSAAQLLEHPFVNRPLRA